MIQSRPARYKHTCNVKLLTFLRPYLYILVHKAYFKWNHNRKRSFECMFFGWKFSQQWNQWLRSAYLGIRNGIIWFKSSLSQGWCHWGCKRPKMNFRSFSRKNYTFIFRTEIWIIGFSYLSVKDKPVDHQENERRRIFRS